MGVKRVREPLPGTNYKGFSAEPDHTPNGREATPIERPPVPNYLLSDLHRRRERRFKPGRVVAITGVLLGAVILGSVIGLSIPTEQLARRGSPGPPEAVTPPPAAKAPGYAEPAPRASSAA